MSVNDGGPAFPVATQVIERGEGLRPWTIEGSKGITIRDYFAAKAMQGLLAQSMGTAGVSDPKFAVDYAYAMADAMIAAREMK